MTTTEQPATDADRSSTLLGLPRRAAVPTIAVVTAAVLLLLAVGVLWFVQRDRILPNTSIDGMDVSGLTESEAREVLAPIAADRAADTVTFTFQGERFELVPDEVGYTVDVDATVAAALERGRQGLPGDIRVRVASYRTPVDVGLRERIDASALGAWADGVADSLDRDEVRGAVSADPDTLEVELVSSQGMVEVDVDTLVSETRQALLEEGSEELTVPAETTPQPIDNAELEALADQLSAAIDGPLVLRSEEAELVLEPRDLVELIEVAEIDGGSTGTTLQLEVTVEGVEDVMGEVAAERFAVSPQNATFVASRTPPARFDAQANGTFRPVEASVSIEGGRLGKEFDPQLAADQLTELVRAGTREAGIQLAEVEPELSPQRAEELRPTHAIGTFTTYYQAGQVRNQNIQLLADVIDGTLVLPGEQFSINEISGERSCEKGYQPAGTIVQGELVDTCGGGTSQFGTTTFNAAFFAGVQLDQWRAHSWYISRYPMGREATLSYPVLDVRFTNTTDGAILVKTSHTSTSVTVTLYGQPIAEAVSATHGSPTNRRDFSEEVRTTSELFEDQERVVQAGTGGFTVNVTRDVQLIGGGTDSQTIQTVYVPQTRIIERGSRARPTQTSSSSPSQDADDGGDADDGDADDADD